MEDTWYAYKHINGTFHLKRCFSKEDLDEAYESPFVDEIYGPWAVSNRAEASKKLHETIGK